MRTSNYSVKRIVTSLFLALGLAPFSEVLADSDDGLRHTGGYRSSATQNTNNVLSSADASANYAGQLNISGYGGNNGGSYFETDVWYPVWQNWDQIFYVDGRIQKDNASSWDWTLGGGGRWLSEDTERLYDVYGFFNNFNSTYGNSFYQGIVGASVKTVNWRFMGNYYHSLGKTQYYSNALDQFKWQPANNSLQNFFYANGYEEQYLNGGILEVGRKIPNVLGLQGFVGYYHFAATDADPDINGVRLRSEYRFDEAFGWRTSWLKHFAVEGLLQYDNVQGTLWTLGVRLTVPLGREVNQSNPLQAMMTDYVEINPHMAPRTQRAPFQAYLNSAGQPATFGIVNSETDLNDFTGSPDVIPDVIVINSDFTTAGTLILNDNQQITGQNLEYKPGAITNLTGRSVTSTLTWAGLQEGQDTLLTVAKNNTVRDLQLKADVLSPQAGIPLQAIANSAGQSVGNLNVSNVNTNGALTIVVADKSKDSVININNNKFTLTGVQGTSSNYVTAFNIQSQNDSVGNVNSISGNTINFLDSSSTPLEYTVGIYLRESNGAGSIGQLVIGNITENTINMTPSTSNVITGGVGIDIVGASANNQIGLIGSNTINIGAGGGSNTGIWVINAGALQTVNMDSNVITIGAGSDNTGILVANTASSGSQTVTITNKGNPKAIITLGASDGSSGVSIANSAAQAGAEQTVTINGMNITLTDDISSNSNYGIIVTNGGITQTINSLSNNTVTMNASTNDQLASVGINIFNSTSGGTQELTAMNNNNVSLLGMRTGTASIDGLTPAIGSAGLIIVNSGVSQTVYMDSNSVTLGTSTGSVGVNVQNTAGTQTVSITNVQNPNATITLGASSGSDGVSVNNAGTTQTIAINGININISDAASGAPNTGIYIGNSGATQNVTSLDNNTIKLDTILSDVGISIANSSAAGVTTVSSMYGNNATQAGTLPNGIALNNSSAGAGAIVININDPSQSTNPGGIMGLEQANNNIGVVNNSSTSTGTLAINATTP